MTLSFVLFALAAVLLSFGLYNSSIGGRRHRYHAETILTPLFVAIGTTLLFLGLALAHGN